MVRVNGESKNMTLVKDVNGENCTLLLMKLFTGNGISDTTFIPEVMEKRKSIERIPLCLDFNLMIFQ